GPRPSSCGGTTSARRRSRTRDRPAAAPMSRASVAARAALLALLAAAPCAAELRAQESAFLDEGAATLFRSARERWRVVDRTLVRYQARVSQRTAASLRLPLRDRTLYRSEAASRLIWERDGGTTVQLLAAREQHPGGIQTPRPLSGIFDAAFDPAGDPLVLGMGGWDDPELELIHPLGSDAELHYRYRSGDTLSVSLPGGRTVRAAQLELVPRRDDPHLLSG